MIRPDRIASITATVTLSDGTEEVVKGGLTPEELGVIHLLRKEREMRERNESPEWMEKLSNELKKRMKKAKTRPQNINPENHDRDRETPSA